MGQAAKQSLGQNPQMQNNPLAMMQEFNKFRRSITPEGAKQRVQELLQSGQTPSCFDPRRAGGSLTDIGIYTVEFMVALFGNSLYYMRLFDESLRKFEAAQEAVLEEQLQQADTVGGVC